MPLSLRLSLLSLLLGSSGLVHAQMPLAELTAGMYRIQAEVAATDRDRRQGLMQRREMPPQHGMLFIFPVAARHCMWMKNTPLPLSVAFLDEAGHILNIEDMEPHTEDNHCAAGAARYALEMNKGWFAGKGIKAGMPIRGVDKLPPPRD